MRRSLALLAPLSALLVGSAAGLRAQLLSDYGEFYQKFTINAVETVTPCYRTDAPQSLPVVYGVRRDSLGRVVQISRFSFGNIEAKSEWATMRIAYTDYEATNTSVQRRTFFNASGMPIGLGWAFAEEIVSRRGTGQLLMRKLVDRDGKPVNDDVGVSRAMFKSETPGVIVQEWYYKTGKVHFGEGSDGPYRPFAEMPPQTYFRKMTVDSNGHLLREEVWNFDKKPIPFPGGELVRGYEVNDCGQPTRVINLDRENRPMSDNSGVASYRFEYDGAGRLIGWEAFDLAGSPKGRPGDGVAAAKFIYRAFDGVLLNEQWFDAAGKQVDIPEEANAENR